MTEKKNKGGRPSGYKPEYVKVAKKMCDLGATMPDVAYALGVTRQTLHNWSSNHKEFFDALTVSRDAADARVERSLFERACGYQHEDVDIRVIDNKVVQTPIVKHYPPDTKAALAWLYNRKPDKWHPKPEEAETGGHLEEALSKLIDKLPG